MPTYPYFCEKCNKEFEASHSIKEELQSCPTCDEAGHEACPPKRLISGGSGFILNGSGWAREGYS